MTSEHKTVGESERQRIKRYARGVAQPGCSLCCGDGFIERLCTRNVVTLCACLMIAVVDGEDREA